MWYREPTHNNWSTVRRAVRRTVRWCVRETIRRSIRRTQRRTMDFPCKHHIRQWAVHFSACKLPCGVRNSSTASNLALHKSNCSPSASQHSYSECNCVHAQCTLHINEHAVNTFVWYLCLVCVFVVLKRNCSSYDLWSVLCSSKCKDGSFLIRLREYDFVTIFSNTRIMRLKNPNDSRKTFTYMNDVSIIGRVNDSRVDTGLRVWRTLATYSKHYLVTSDKVLVCKTTSPQLLISDIPRCFPAFVAEVASVDRFASATEHATRRGMTSHGLFIMSLLYTLSEHITGSIGRMTNELRSQHETRQTEVRRHLWNRPVYRAVKCNADHRFMSTTFLTVERRSHIYDVPIIRQANDTRVVTGLRVGARSQPIVNMIKSYNYCRLHECTTRLITVKRRSDAEVSPTIFGYNLVPTACVTLRNVKFRQQLNRFYALFVEWHTENDDLCFFPDDLGFLDVFSPKYPYISWTKRKADYSDYRYFVVFFNFRLHFGLNLECECSWLHF